MLAFVIYYSETEKDGPQHMSSHNESSGRQGFVSWWGTQWWQRICKW